MPVGAYHRFRAHTGEKLDRWQEGALILFGLRLLGLAMLACGLVWLIEPGWLAWAAWPLPAWLRWAGVALAAGGGVLMSWTMHNLGKNLTDTVVTRREHALVTTGPYRWIRHPFYTACLLGVAGGSLMMANWLVMLLGVLGAALLYTRTKKEEENLIKRFGDAYRQYMQRVGRFLPRLPFSESDVD